jgi:hypothetical protein
MADNCRAFPPRVLCFVAATGLLLLTDIRAHSRYLNWTGTADLFLLLVWQHSAFTQLQGAALDMDKIHFFLRPQKPIFCNFKSKFPLNFKVKHQRFNIKKPIDWYQFLPPLIRPGLYLSKGKSWEITFKNCLLVTFRKHQLSANLKT